MGQAPSLTATGSGVSTTFLNLLPTLNNLLPYAFCPSNNQNYPIFATAGKETEMKFIAEKKETVLLPPGEEGRRRSIPSEIRTDPLTGRTSRICHFMKLDWPLPDFEALIAGTEEWCPFCPERVMEVTPSFPPELLPEGRLISGSSILCPNVAPYDALSAVAVMSDRHFIPLADLTPGLIGDNLKLCQEFFRRVDETGASESVYHLVNWNYMPPAGSSLIHPHLQVFVSSHAPNLMRQENAGAGEYFDRTGRNYWADLVRAEEVDGSRFLGRIGRTVWLASFTPLGVAGDVLAVVEGARSTLDLTDQDLDNLALGLTKALAGYAEMGIYSFNLNYFTGPLGDPSAGFHILFSPRAFFNQALGTPDVGAIRNLYNESLCMAFPEEIAEQLRPGFGL